MLVRDIELKDSILDLLDNCVDGILRTKTADLTKAKPYAGYRADIVVSPECFVIEDNCGGIPLRIAINSAFAIGKPEPIVGADAVATVGMYGIGMKRAIFKLGQNAVVDSWNDKPFRVKITPEWLGADGWDQLPMAELPVDALAQGHTRIFINHLHPAIRADFELESFVDELVNEISQNYAIIIDKGFAVTVRTNLNDGTPEPIPAKSLALLRTVGGGIGAIAPYVYVGQIDGVDVEIYAGLYRRLPTEEERDREEETKGSKDDAGWTVACNDRVVVWKDRTRLTGWGEATVPNYHGQFIAITGIVLLRSEDPRRLPLTTTKRGLDAGSDIYSKVKDMMREATKGLTSFTNKWKNFEDELENLYKDTTYVELADLRQEAPAVAQRVYHRFADVKRYAPNLPTPVLEKTSSRVSFQAAKAEISRLSLVYFGQTAAKASEVGEEAFRRELALYPEAAE